MTDDVKNVIRKLDTSKSCGLDKIPANILKDCNEIVAPYLTYIYITVQLLRQFSQMTGKRLGCHQFLKAVPRKIATTISQFLFYQQWPKYLKN